MLDSNLLEVTKEGVAEAAALLGCVADPIRLGLVTTLAKRGKTCVCTMQEEAEVPANLLSYHLKVLREAGLVTATRRGRRRNRCVTSSDRERTEPWAPLLLNSGRS